MRLGGKTRCLSSLTALASVMVLGCQGPPPEVKPAAPSFVGVELRLGALDRADILGGAAALRGEWVASRGGQITLVDKPLTLDSVATADVFFFPAARMGDLVDKGKIAVIPRDALVPRRATSEADLLDPKAATGDQTESDNEGGLKYKDILPGFREEACRYGEDYRALPVGGSALVLVYLRDAFESKVNQEAARAAGIKLEPPRTWADLEVLARFMEGRDWDGDGALEHGLAAPLGRDAEGVADGLFLARAASLGLHRDHYALLFDSDTMAPRLDSPPLVEALKGHVALKAAGPAGCERFDAPAARKAFKAGETALLIDRAERASEWSNGKPIGVAPLPGSTRVYEPALTTWQETSLLESPCMLSANNCWLVGMSAGLEGNRREAALDLVKYLANPDNVNRLRTERGFPMLAVRTSQLGQGLPDPTMAPDVDARLWSDAVARTLQAQRVVMTPRLPGAAAYLEALAQGRMAALEGEPVEKALADAAGRFQILTKTFGPNRSIWHYRRSLNHLATLPTPPEPGT